MKQIIRQLKAQMAAAIALLEAMSFGLPVLVTMYLLRLPHISRLLLSIFVVLNLGLLYLEKTVVFVMLRRYRARGYNVRAVLIKWLSPNGPVLYRQLPQFINVLKGEVSIVGPRPPLPSEVKCYERWERRRLSMKPGITCYWQIQPNRNDLSFKEWMKLDLAYIDNWSLWCDTKIIFRTAWVMITGSGR
jgi:hypothetical protein